MAQTTGSLQTRAQAPAATVSERKGIFWERMIFLIRPEGEFEVWFTQHVVKQYDELAHCCS